MARTSLPRTAATLAAAALSVPFLMGAGNGGGGCGAIWNQDASPEIAGTWAVAYDDSLAIEITLGGAVYTAETGVDGGTIEIEHEGQPLTFELDCDDENILCPSEAWPAELDFEQRNAQYPHQFHALLPTQVCDGELVDPEPAECGEDTANPDCEQVCDGEMVPSTSDRFGWVADDGSGMSLVLGAGYADNGINCALLGLSAATADLVTSGSAQTEDWIVDAMELGEVTVAYTGGCLWADDVDGDEDLEAVVLGASISITTGFDAARVEAPAEGV